MDITGQVMCSSVEPRELVGKDGKKRTTLISHVLLNCTTKRGDSQSVEICNVRAYDAKFPLPEVGKSWTTPRVRKYECFDGTISEVLV